MCLAYDGSQVDIANIIFKVVTIIGFKCKVVVEKPRLAAGLIVSACGGGDQTLLLGFAWLWTGVLTTPNTRRRSRLYLKRITLF